jgi:hypothetical protein
MKNYKIKLRYHIEYEVEIVSSTESAVAAMDDALKLKLDLNAFKPLHTSPIAIHSVAEMIEDVI